MNKLIHLCLLLLCLPSTQTHASPILQVSADGILTGAKGIFVGGPLIYDVEFIDGTCADLFSGCDDPTDFVFDDINLAVYAARTLLNSVFVDTAAGKFDARPELTRGCALYATDAVPQCAALTPYFYNNGPSSVLFYFFAPNLEDPFNEDPFSVYRSISALTPVDLVHSPSQTFARWSVASNSIPVPGTSSCIGIAGLALILSRRRRPHTA